MRDGQCNNIPLLASQGGQDGIRIVVIVQGDVRARRIEDRDMRYARYGIHPVNAIACYTIQVHFVVDDRKEPMVPVGVGRFHNAESGGIGGAIIIREGTHARAGELAHARNRCLILEISGVHPCAELRVVTDTQIRADVDERSFARAGRWRQRWESRIVAVHIQDGPLHMRPKVSGQRSSANTRE